MGRGWGVAGGLMVASALGVIVVSVWLIVTHGPITDVYRWPTITVFGRSVPQLVLLPALGVLDALIAVMIGGAVVHRAETTQRRPSGLARMSGGLGVLTLGMACGVILYILTAAPPPAPVATIAPPLDDATPAVADVADQAVQLTTDAAQAAAPEGMSMVSYILLAGMLTLLVVGLGWCFYRAIRASAAAKAEVQEPEV